MQRHNLTENLQNQAKLLRQASKNMKELASTIQDHKDAIDGLREKNCIYQQVIKDITV